MKTKLEWQVCARMCEVVCMCVCVCVHARLGTFLPVGGGGWGGARSMEGGGAGMARQSLHIPIEGEFTYPF